MPEYLAPGVYVEETSYRAKSIEGVSTSTAGFIGPTRSGPQSGRPEVLTSFAEFQRVYGGLEDLSFGTNYLAHSARAFFEEGGARLYVARVVGAGAEKAWTIVNGMVEITARDRGNAGNVSVTFELTVGRNSLLNVDGVVALSRTRNHDSVVALLQNPDPNHPNDAAFTICSADRDLAGVWTLVDGNGGVHPLQHVGNDPRTYPTAVYPLTVRIDVARPTLDGRGLPTFGPAQSYGPMSLSPDAPDGAWKVFATDPRGEAPPVELATVAGSPSVATIAWAIAPLTSPLTGHWLSPVTTIDAPVAPEPVTVVLSGGIDGAAPTKNDYSGDADLVTGLEAFAAIDDISIVAAPGSSELDEAAAIRNAVIGHCERMRYRVAVIDTPSQSSVNEARAWRGERSSLYSALYYPWVTVPDPFVGSSLSLPPSGFVAGIWARNDINRAVFKAPANEVIRSVTNLERRLTKGQQDVLNPEGVNCLRFFSGRGNLVWGARTMTDDPEWKYVSVRRYFAYLERSIDRSTQWAVFESNGDALWANVRRTIEDFLLSEWKSGALLGTDPKQAFFVRCDRTTMLQNDLDNGRLVCLIGVAVVKPAEFVIFRIGQWTATASN